MGSNVASGSDVELDHSEPVEYCDCGVHIIPFKLNAPKKRKHWRRRAIHERASAIK